MTKRARSVQSHSSYEREAEKLADIQEKNFTRTLSLIRE